MKMQSVGNLVAVASCKPNHATGEIVGNVSALGHFAVGEIIETMTVRLFEFDAKEIGGNIGREIVGTANASAWQPWEVKFETTELSVARSTTWQDEHVQQWRYERTPKDLVVWIEFETRAPGEWRAVDNRFEWHSATGDVVAVATDGHIDAASAATDAAQVRRSVEQNKPAFSPIIPKDRWYRGVIAWIRRGPADGLFALTTSRDREKAIAKLAAALSHPKVVAKKAQADWEAFFANDIPACPIDTDTARTIWLDAWFVLRANHMDYARAPLAKPFGSPSKFNYHHQWLWDSGFHAIVWRWANSKHWSQEETANLFDNQLEQGRICHEIFFSPWRREDAWPTGRGCFAPTSQPPVLAMAVEKIFAKAKDLQWLQSLYPRLIPYLDWWGTVRDPDGDNLAGWANGYESGLDDSPRWDHITRSGNAYYPAPLEATELNALLVNEWRSVARLARLLDRSADADFATRKADVIKAAMRAKLWNEQDGFFYCLDHEEQPIRIKTIGGLLGLLALDPGDREIAPLLGHLTNKSEFWTAYPVPTVALNENSFERGQMWRGPTWINTNWLLIRALERLHQLDIARELKERTFALVVAEGGPKLWEWYDPMSGKALGNMEYGWSTLVIDLMME